MTTETNKEQQKKILSLAKKVQKQVVAGKFSIRNFIELSRNGSKDESLEILVEVKLLLFERYILEPRKAGGTLDSIQVSEILYRQYVEVVEVCISFIKSSDLHFHFLENYYLSDRLLVQEKVLLAYLLLKKLGLDRTKVPLTKIAHFVHLLISEKELVGKVQDTNIYKYLNGITNEKDDLEPYKDKVRAVLGAIGMSGLV